MTEFFSNIYLSWVDLIDIGIMSLIIYNIILLVQGTRSIQILLGFLAIITLFYTAKFLELKSILWVLQNLFQYIVIIIIIIFQTDIRNALANFGRAKIFKRDSNVSLVDITRIIQTVADMQQTKTGMILAFERRIGLGEYIKTGFLIDAIISSQLLLSIFQQKSPIHDGAVIVDTNFRIAASCCILPLASRADKSTRYGTRHRAAIGLSELTDALILVVSEETSKISVFLENTKKENLNLDKLESILRENLLEKKWTKNIQT